MGKGKFNLNQILSDASKAAASGGATVPRPAESRFEKISVFDLIPSEENFYSMREIDELKAAIEIAGKVLQNLVVVPLDGGKFKVISGHRRRLASIALVEAGKPQYEFVPCDVEPTEEAAEDQEVRDGLMLIVTNSQREKTAWDKIEEVRFLREVLEKARTKPRFVAVLQNIVATAFGGGAEVQADGTRDFIAKVLHTSTTQIGRYDAIIRNLCPAFKAELKEDRINISTAYELSGLPAAEQQAAFEEYRASGEISIRAARERKQDPPPAINQPPAAAESTTGAGEPPEPAQDAPHAPAEPPKEDKQEEAPPAAELPAEGRAEPQEREEAAERKEPPATSYPSPMDTEPQEQPHNTTEVARVIGKLEELKEWCIRNGEEWREYADAISFAVEKLEEGRADD